MGREGYIRFQGAKKRPAKGQELNDLVSIKVLKVLKQSKYAKATDM